MCHRKLQPAKVKTRWEKWPEQEDQQSRVELGSGEATALLTAAKSPEAEPERKDLTHNEQSQGDCGHCLYSIVCWKPLRWVA